MSKFKIALLIVVIVLILFIATNRGIRDRLVRAFGKPKQICRLSADAQANQIVAPSFGKVAEIKTLATGDVAIAITLTVTDVHTQYVPIAGRVKAVIVDDTGKYNIVMQLDKSAENSKIITKLTTRFGSVYVFQIAGYLTRYIDNYLTEGVAATSGQLLGKIKFGSRVDIILPAAGYGAALRVYAEVGDHIKGAETVIAEYVKK